MDYDEYRKLRNTLLAFLSHYCQDVEKKLVSSDQSESVNNKQDLISLLTITHHVAHPRDEIKGRMIQVVEQDIRLYVYRF